MNEDVEKFCIFNKKNFQILIHSPLTHGICISIASHDFNVFILDETKITPHEYNDTVNIPHFFLNKDYDVPALHLNVPYHSAFMFNTTKMTQNRIEWTGSEHFLRKI